MKHKLKLKRKDERKILIEEEVGENNGFSLITDYDGSDEQAFDVNIKLVKFFRFLPPS